MSTVATKSASAKAAAKSRIDELIEALPGVARVGFAPAVVLVSLVVGYVQGPGVAILVLAGGALAGAIMAFWDSIRAAFGDTQLSAEDAFSIGAPSAEEEQKRAVLRAIKDLEFERSVGKITEEDYDALIARYRAQAKQLLRVIDDRDRPERDKVEKLLTRRLVDEGLLDKSALPEEDRSKAKKRKKKRAESAGKRARVETSAAEAVDAEPTRDDRHRPERDVACPSCEVRNDGDAVFCKKCGARLAAEEEAS